MNSNPGASGDDNSSLPTWNHPQATNLANYYHTIYKQAVYHVRNGNPDRAYQIFVNLTQDARVPRQTLAFSYHALILFGPSRSMSQINLDHCRAVAQTLIDEKVRVSLIMSLDDLQIELDQMEEGIWRSMLWRSRGMEEQALGTTVKQEERSSVVTEMKHADGTDGAATALPDDGRSSPPFSAPGIEAQVDFVATWLRMM